MKISIIVEGKTEQAFKTALQEFIKSRLPDHRPRLDFLPCHGRVPKENKLRRIVHTLLRGRDPSDCVIALTDVYTGTTPPDFSDATDAKNKMRQWVGEEPRFVPHAAQYDFEAWLLPYWKSIQQLAGHNRAAPSGRPETINHTRPPSYRIAEVFEAGTSRKSYNKPRDAGRILRENDLMVAINACVELKAFINTILSVCGERIIPE